MIDDSPLRQALLENLMAETAHDPEATHASDSLAAERTSQIEHLYASRTELWRTLELIVEGVQVARQHDPDLSDVDRHTLVIACCIHAFNLGARAQQIHHFRTSTVVPPQGA